MSHLTIRIVLFGCAGALFGSFGLCLPVYSLTTSPGGQQGNLPGFVLGTAAGLLGLVAGVGGGVLLGLWADRRARRSGLRVDLPTAVVGAVMLAAAVAFAVWYVWALRKTWGD